MITGLITLSPFWLSFFSPRSPLFPPPGHLYFLPPPSLLNPILWISVGVLGFGEHLGNRVLPRFVSLILIPRFFLLLLTSIPFLPLLFFMQLCEPLWVSLIVENLFIINLEVLLSVLYGWRHLEATGRMRLKTRGKGLSPKPENTGELLNPGNIN